LRELPKHTSDGPALLSLGRVFTQVGWAECLLPESCIDPKSEPTSTT
jgi:hypothetical protein